MNTNGQSDMDSDAKPVDTSTPKRVEIEVNGQKLWLDWDTFRQEQEFMRKKEEEYWEYHFSGQRTIDMFGVEGAKRVLERQHRDDMKMIFNHRSRGKK